MNVYDAIMKRRTIRKFEQKAVSEDNLVKLVDCARVAAYGANVQPLAGDLTRIAGVRLVGQRVDDGEGHVKGLVVLKIGRAHV